MPKHVFLTGLPRMRSAWLATYLTYGDSFFYHDAFSGLAKLETFKEMMNKPQYRVVGNSDPANVLFWEKLAEWYPDATWIIVNRDFEETLASCKKAFPNFTYVYLRMLQDKLNSLKMRAKAIEFDYNDLNIEAVNIAVRCGVYPGPPERRMQLNRLNIQVHPQTLADEVRTIVLSPPQFLQEAIA